MKIHKLVLFTKELSQQKNFYTKDLGFELLEENSNYISFQIGHTILEFRESVTFQPYHFAFNIPSNKEKEALTWLKEKVTILKDGDNEIQYFDFWNANAIYFFDADGNIVEFISRKNLKNSTSEPFNNDQVLCVSEIGIPTSSIENIYSQIHEKAKVPLFSGSMERICAQGNEDGLFILVDKNEKKWYPINQDANSVDFELIFEEQERHYWLICQQEQVTIDEK